jgi:ribose transport system substrate-binding protein
MVKAAKTGTEELGIQSPQAAEASSTLEGQLMANYVPVEMGPTSNVAVYYTPELPFAVIGAEVFTEELEKVCPECSVRQVKVSAETLGSTAPSTVVSDLQANPETTVAVFFSDEIEIGLPAALKSAGIEVKTLGLSPTPTNLQYLKEGKETAALGTDLPVLSWSLLDQAAREIAGQELTGNEAKGITVQQFLTKDDITFNPKLGWTGYPNYPEMFAELWGVKG